MHVHVHVHVLYKMMVHMYMYMYMYCTIRLLSHIIISTDVQYKGCTITCATRVYTFFHNMCNEGIYIYMHTLNITSLMYMYMYVYKYTYGTVHVCMLDQVSLTLRVEKMKIYTSGAPSLV